MVFLFGTKEIDEEIIVKRTKLAIAFLTHTPFFQYHLLISPIRSVSHFLNLSEDERNEIVDLIVECQEIVKKTVPGVRDFTVICQDGPNAGQTVSHNHTHLFPRIAGDLEKLYGEKVENNKVYQDLDKRPIKDHSELVKDAEELRKNANLV